MSADARFAAPSTTSDQRARLVSDIRTQRIAMTGAPITTPSA